jgi:hypothetical protein
MKDKKTRQASKRGLKEPDPQDLENECNIMTVCIDGVIENLIGGSNENAITCGLLEQWDRLKQSIDKAMKFYTKRAESQAEPEPAA